MEDVEAAFEFGGSVVGGQDGAEPAQHRELGDREPVQAEPVQAVGLVRIAGQFLQLVQDVAVQEAEQGPVEVQGVGSAEAGPGEQRDAAACRRGPRPCRCGSAAPW